MDRYTRLFTGVPDYGYGPMTDDTIAGNMSPILRDARIGEAERSAEWWYDQARPYAGEPAARAIESGAKTLVDLSPIQSLVDAYDQPSIGTVTNAGVRSLMSVGRPLQALSILGAGYGTAGAKDLGVFNALAPASAEAKKSKPNQILYKMRFFIFFYRNVPFFG